MLIAIDVTTTIAIVVIALAAIGGGCLVHGGLRIHAAGRIGELATDARWFLILIALAFATDCIVAAVAAMVLMLPRLS